MLLLGQGAVAVRTRRRAEAHPTNEQTSTSTTASASSEFVLRFQSWWSRLWSVFFRARPPPVEVSEPAQHRMACDRLSNRGSRVVRRNESPCRRGSPNAVDHWRARGSPHVSDCPGGSIVILGLPGLTSMGLTIRCGRPPGGPEGTRVYRHQIGGGNPSSSKN